MKTKLFVKSLFKCRITFYLRLRDSILSQNKLGELWNNESGTCEGEVGELTAHATRQQFIPDA